MPTSRNEQSVELAELHYAVCDYCPLELNHWSVVVDESGDIVRLECEHCGGTGWERGQEAP